MHGLPLNEEAISVFGEGSERLVKECSRAGVACGEKGCGDKATGRGEEEGMEES